MMQRMNQGHPKIKFRSLRLRPELDEALARIGERENRSTHKQIIHFLEQAVERDEEKTAA